MSQQQANAAQSKGEWEVKHDATSYPVEYRVTRITPDGDFECLEVEAITSSGARALAHEVAAKLNGYDAMLNAMRLMRDAKMIPALSSLPNIETEVGNAAKAAHEALALAEGGAR